MPVFASVEPAPTPDDLATLRRLIGTDARTDEQLTPYLERHRCPVIDPTTGEAGDETTADPYGAAAEVWEERAFAAAADSGGQTVTSRRHGDAAETYATGGGTVSGPAAMLAIAARLRRRSCGWKGGSRTITVAPPAALDIDRLDALDDLDVTDRRVVVNAAEARD